jgi:hypothetical protein
VEATVRGLRRPVQGGPKAPGMFSYSCVEGRAAPRCCPLADTIELLDQCRRENHAPVVADGDTYWLLAGAAHCHQRPTASRYTPVYLHRFKEFTPSASTSQIDDVTLTTPWQEQGAGGRRAATLLARARPMREAFIRASSAVTCS